MSVSFNPIGPWYIVVAAALFVTALTLWAYYQRLQGTAGVWRWFALALRLAAVLLCVIAALRPSVIYQEKKKQPSVIVFMIDGSTSMTLTDEAGGKSRWETALSALGKARRVAEGLGPKLSVKSYRFDTTVREQPRDDKSEPNGRSTALGAALQEALKRQEGMRIASIIVLSDGANNDGLNPMSEARILRSHQVPVVTVGFGSENAGAASRDIAVRDLGTGGGDRVFVKNQLLIKGSIVVRGFPNQPVDVELYTEGNREPVAKTRLKAPQGSEVIPITGLKYVPQTPGEKKITLKVKPKDGELNKANNEVSTYVRVETGGLNVLFLQGPHSPWEGKYFLRSIKASDNIEADEVIIRKLDEGGEGAVKDEWFAPGRYNAYVLSDLPAELLTQKQQQLLTRAVEKGAGLIMLGGRSSFGAGGWADSPLASVLPVLMNAGDRQLEPEGGLPFVPNTTGLENYLFQIAGDRATSRRLWLSLTPLTGANELVPKQGAIVLAQSSGRNPPALMVGIEAGEGRTLAFGGETWPWLRSSNEGLAAHRKFWRQVVFWLAHKENQGETKVDLKLGNRRVAIGEKLEMTVTTRDAKNAVIPNVTYDAKVTREGGKTPPEPIVFYDDGEQARSAYPAVGQPGEYKVTVTARRDGKEIGRDEARFMVYEDDREMDNPAADIPLLRQVAETTGGEFLAPEKLPQYLKSLTGKIFTESVTQTEKRIWDNWPFFLVFTALLTLEWWLRKRHGWV